LIAQRDEVLRKLNECGIYPGVHYNDNTNYKPYISSQNSCPKAKEYSDRVISLPLNLNLMPEDVEYVSDQLIKICKDAK
jgi:dTDP-4-amino-4,6-dideoxygalactose transaminase